MAPLIRRVAAAAAAVKSPAMKFPDLDTLLLAPRTPPAVAARLLADFPSRTLSDTPSRAIAAREDATTSTIPAGYGSLKGGPDPGTVAGITLGAVAGFLLLLWFIQTILGLGGTVVGMTDGASSVGTASAMTRKHRSHQHQSRERSSRRRETVEVRSRSRAGGPTIIVEEGLGGGGERVERVVMEERTRRSVSRQPSAGPPPPRVVTRSDDDDDDEVVVIEEHSPERPRRHRSKRHSSGGAGDGGGGGRSRRESGYRDIDPDRFAGGDAPMRDPRRGSRRYSREK